MEENTTVDEAIPKEAEESKTTEEEKVEDNEGGEEVKDEGGEGEEAAKKKKKRKKKKKKKKSSATNATNEDGSATATGGTVPSQKPHGRLLKDTAFTDYFVKYGQTNPPTIPVSDLFSNNEFPIGEIEPHPLPEINTYRETSAEKRANDRLQEDVYSKVRHAAEVSDLFYLV